MDGLTAFRKQLRSMLAQPLMRDDCLGESDR